MVVAVDYFSYIHQGAAPSHSLSNTPCVQPANPQTYPCMLPGASHKSTISVMILISHVSRIDMIKEKNVERTLQQASSRKRDIILNDLE